MVVSSCGSSVRVVANGRVWEGAVDGASLFWWTWIGSLKGSIAGEAVVPKDVANLDSAIGKWDPVTTATSVCSGACAGEAVGSKSEDSNRYELLSWAAGKGGCASASLTFADAGEVPAGHSCAC